MRREIIFCALICCNIGAFAKSVGEKQTDEVDLQLKAEDESRPPRPGTPLFNNLQSLASSNFQQVASQISSQIAEWQQALNIQNVFPAAQVIKATTTEYVEVTRRQTVHPVCYTAYAVKAPCLPYRQNDNDENKEDGSDQLELHTANHVHESYDLYGDEDVISEQTIQPTSALGRMMATEAYQLENSRSGKYLIMPKDKVKSSEPEEKDEIRLEGSETASVTSAAASTTLPFLPFINRQTTEYVTKTVLITRLEKFTDHRVTATMVAHNCLPVDPNMRRCRGYINPIYDAPILKTHQKDAKKGEKDIIIASVVHTKPGVSVADYNQEILAAVQAVNQASSSVQNNRRPERPQVIPPLISGILGIHLGDDVENSGRVTAVENIDEAPIVEDADPEVKEAAEEEE